VARLRAAWRGWPLGPAQETIDPLARLERTCSMALLIQPKAVKAARGMPRQDWDRLKERLERIARNPYGKHPDVERLTGGGFRVRQGDWRAVYDITASDDVLVVRVGNRREVYRI
jgi:mRNA-degrading endonuclease RelE of RelBE toxin-antitoxin system